MPCLRRPEGGVVRSIMEVFLPELEMETVELPVFGVLQVAGAICLGGANIRLFFAPVACFFTAGCIGVGDD